MKLFDKEFINFIHDHETEDIYSLALQGDKFSTINFPLALQQIAGRKIAKRKLPLWYAQEQILYPEKISMEQCSSQITAQYKSSLLLNSFESFADLTGGFEVDFSIIAPHAKNARYVESNSKLHEIVKHNFQQFGHLNHVSTHLTTAEDFLAIMPLVDVIFIDPARRNQSGKKVFQLQDLSPDVSAIKQELLSKAHTILIKLSPMIDITKAVDLMGGVSSVHIVSVENECKELLLEIKKDEISTKNYPYHTLNFNAEGIASEFHFEKENEKELLGSYIEAEKLGAYLYEPNASILKAGAFKTVAHKFGICKLHPNTHLYTSDTYIDNFPGRIFRIVDILPASAPQLKRYFRNKKCGHITVRNFPMTSNELRKITGIGDGGDDYYFATTLFNRRKVFLHCHKLS